MNALDLNTRIQRTRIIVWFERTKMMDGASLTSHTRLNHSMLFYWYARLCGRLQTEQRYTMCQSNRAYLNTQRAKESERRRQQQHNNVRETSTQYDGAKCVVGNGSKSEQARMREHSLNIPHSKRTFCVHFLLTTLLVRCWTVCKQMVYVQDS